MSEKINLNIKLSAYTKGLLPTKLSELENDTHYLQDAQGSLDKDGKYYARRDGHWEEITQPKPVQSDIILAENSGLNLEDFGDYRLLSIKEVLTDEFPDTFEDDTTYYIVENTPDIYINGGTAFSDGNNEFVNESEYDFIIDGGRSNTNNFELDLLPIDAKGVYNE